MLEGRKLTLTVVVDIILAAHMFSGGQTGSNVGLFAGGVETFGQDHHLVTRNVVLFDRLAKYLF